jgi:DNA-binding LacI/PurR family transcriptional regulator
VAFVVAEPEDRFFDDPYFSLVLRGAHTAVAEHDVQLVFSVLATNTDRERFERFARGGHLEG